MELSGDRYEVFPDISPYGTIGEYGVFALIPQVRVRYPVFEDKLVPYFVGGVGAAFTQFNDRKPRGFGLSIQDQSSTVVAATAGLGIEYFIADNIAVGIEGRYLFAPDPTLVVQGNREKVKISAPALHLRDADVLSRADTPRPWPRRASTCPRGSTSASAPAAPSSSTPS